MNIKKVFFSSLLILFSIGILGYQRLNSFDIIFPVVGTICCVGLLMIVLSNSPTIGLRDVVISLVSISIFYRLGMFLLSPSLIGVDSIKHSVQVEWVTRSGTISSLPDGFYQIAALFQIYTAQTGLLTGLRSDHALVIFPLLTGVLVPLTAVALVRCVDTEISEFKIAGISGVIAISTTGMNLFSIAPIAQVMSVLLFMITIFTTIKYVNNSEMRCAILIFILLLSMSFVHKLPIFVYFISIATLVTFLFTKQRSIKYRRSSVVLTLLTGSVLTVQWAYVTDFFWRGITIASTAGMKLYNGNYGIGSSGSPSSHAVSAHPTLFEAVLNSSYLTIIIIAFFSALLLSYHIWGRNDITITIILAVIAPVSVLVTAGTFSPLMGGAIRYLLFGELFLSVTIAVGFGVLFRKYIVTIGQFRTIARTSAIILIILVVGAQFGAAPAVPDHNDTPRLYLTPEEVNAKNFELDYIQETVYSDRYYSRYVVNPEIPVNREQSYAMSLQSPGIMSDALKNATIIDRGYGYVTVRSEVEVYRLGGAGWYYLTWDQDKVLSKYYNKVYTSDSVSTYAK